MRTLSMRFLLKIVFWLALIAFFLPSTDDSDRPGINVFAAFLGAQEALSDMGGFCERSPMACDTGREVGSYVAARVADGMAYAYGMARGQMENEPASLAATQAPVPAAAGAAAAKPETPDPMQTAAVAAERVRQTVGLVSFDMPAMGGRPQADSRSSSAPVDSQVVLPPSRLVTPTPRP